MALMGKPAADRLLMAAIAIAALGLFVFSWREGREANEKARAQIHAAGLDNCPAHAITRWRGELICDQFYVDNPTLTAPSEGGHMQALYDQRPRPREFRK